MHERIKELAHKAEFINKRHNGDEWRWCYIDPELSAKLEKFAELIVKECAQVAKLTEDDDGDDYKSGRVWASIDVLKHFGVEE